tara:strand:- start:1070 stop:1270 length:201 start_codon:yes stop_codon:yes gene_type:complete
MALNNQDEDSLPYTGSQLVDKLNEVFPEKSAELGMSIEELMFKGGQRSVVNWLRELQKREEQQNED